jgi:hypothetical protein
MLLIRDQQRVAMARVALPKWIANHLQQFFPRECAALGDAGLRDRVREGIARAAAHGFETEIHISQYVDLMFVFGTDFDTDSALAWPQPILSDRTISAAERMDRLLDAGRRHGQEA